MGLYRIGKLDEALNLVGHLEATIASEKREYLRYLKVLIGYKSSGSKIRPFELVKEIESNSFINIRTKIILILISIKNSDFHSSLSIINELLAQGFTIIGILLVVLSHIFSIGNTNLYELQSYIYKQNSNQVESFSSLKNALKVQCNRKDLYEKLLHEIWSRSDMKLKERVLKINFV